MILVAGSANLDFVILASHVPAPGETVLGREFSTFPGGKGANQAIACARAGGAETTLLVALGDDAFAATLEASLESAGVRMNIVRVAGESTGTAFVCVSDDGENAITVAPGANSMLRAAHLPSLDGVTHLLMQLEIPLDTVTAYAREARARGITVVLNAAPARSLPAELLSLLDVLILNRGELAAVTGDTGDLANCVALIHVPCIVVTLGEHGAYARMNGEEHVQDAFRVDAVDTTGAGDTFCGVLVAALARGVALGEALREASAAGALACTRLGAQASIPSRTEVTALLIDSAAAAGARNLGPSFPA